MFNLTEQDEIKYLSKIIDKLNLNLAQQEQIIGSYSASISESKSYLWENIYELDPAEIASNKQAISQTINNAEFSLEAKRKILKLIKSPYFARIDFKYDGETKEEPIYIGIYSLSDEESFSLLIYDWRAPISSMFYDFEKGAASYDAPAGKMTGEIGLKRQYKISNGQLEYMLESSLNINDEILQKELSKTSDMKMQNIVQTIQRDQNKIIRNTSSEVLIIQGAAGSGKTSIALHRVAYLLYKYKDTLKSKNVLIISPNKIFSDYISTVLPELGEEKILEVSMEDIAKNELGKSFKFERFYEQIAGLLEKTDIDYISRIQYKASLEIVEKMDEYVKHITERYFTPKNIKLGDYTVESDFIFSRYSSYTRYTVKERIDNVIEDVIDKIESEKNCRIKNATETQITEIITSMFKTFNLLELYEDFYKYIGKEELFFLGKRKKLEYADVFPLIYLKMHVIGCKDFSYIKHLVVDEMQDYSPIQYAVISKMFKCKKTILGDKFQSVNLYSSSSKELINDMFPKSDILELSKSYRSTYEITNFAQEISRNENLVAIERHGEKPGLIKYTDIFKEILKLIGKFKEANYHSLGIICKTQKQAKKLIYQLDEVNIRLLLRVAGNIEINLLDEDSTEFTSGIVVTTPYIAKGLEFDQVIIIDGDDLNYATEMDKGMLYIGCTRAMHKLDVLYKGNVTKFIQK